MDGDRISGLFGFLFGVFIIRDGVRLDIGGFHQPEPGLFVLLGGVFLAIFSALILLQSILAKTITTDSETRGGIENPWVIVFIFMGLVIYVLIFEWLGFIITTFLLVTFLLRLLEQKKWWNILLTAGVITLSTFIIFNVFLKSGLPKGILGVFH